MDTEIHNDNIKDIITNTFECDFIEQLEKLGDNLFHTQNTPVETPNYQHRENQSQRDVYVDIVDEPIYIVEARLLHLYVQFSIPMHAYKYFMDWEKLIQTSS